MEGGERRAESGGRRRETGESTGEDDRRYTRFGDAEYRTGDRRQVIGWKKGK